MMLGMKQLKRLIRNNLPPALHDWVVFQGHRGREVLAENRRWKGTGRGKRAWVLATGPSIKQQDLSLLRGEDCFSVSNFFLHDQLAVISPKAHFFAPYHPPLIRENYLDWLAKADAALPKETVVVLGLSDRAMIESRGLFAARRKVFLALGARRFRNIDCEKLMPTVQTGPQMILGFLIYAGYREIYLLGCDHDALRNYGATVENFYPPTADVRVNAISGAGWLPVIEHLQTQINAFRIYEKFMLSNPEVRLYNCSPSSWLRFTKMPSADYLSVIKVADNAGSTKAKCHP